MSRPLSLHHMVVVVWRMRLRMSCYHVVQKILVIVGDFQETNAHTESRVILINPIKIRPNHSADDIYDLMIGGNDADTIIFIQSERFLTGDENTMGTDIFGFALNGAVIRKYIDPPGDLPSFVFTPFDFPSHDCTSFNHLQYRGLFLLLSNNCAIKKFFEARRSP